MIRKATLNDVCTISALEKDVLGESLGESFLYDELALNPFSHYFVYEKNGQIIAYVGFRAIDSQAEMLNFVVSIDNQNQGIGSKLMSFVLDYLDNLQVKTISLEVRESNKKAQFFYHKFGFSFSHIRPHYYRNEDAHIYIREVNL